ncbi:TetR/AcrR family transcriptional regulator [Nonomuraea terrae]|uniref:TetR/AcrR family transcriptional regulator n=1 Tax=Nonomuraea terrae TaxID=2530383 RepID=A0A4V2YKP4_9ACTN|nr:TetR/AcrR family transcriptional regulator [Nonomuraea terrae]TDD43097.1 TetR/AcrR family transcriptional regulator [Nonomuraea terrae]
MMSETSSGQVRRGRPRSEKARQEILDAAAELLLERGLEAVSMDAVAERAGVSKATIYRWWRTKETLALDALYQEWAAMRPGVRDTGSLRGDLLSLLRPWVRIVSARPYGRIIAALISEAHTDPAFAEQYRAHFVEPRREWARVIIRRAIGRGEIAASTRIEVAVDLLYGSFYHRLLHGHAPLTETFVREVVDMLISGLGGPPVEGPAEAESVEGPARSNR